MDTRLGVVTVAVAALVLLAGCGAALQTAGDPVAGAGSDAEAAQRTISTSGTGTADAEADLAIVRVAVTARADTAEAAREAVASDAARMRAALRDAGVDDDAVTTAYYRIAPQYEVNGDRDGRTLVGYEAVHAYRLDAAADRAGTVVDAALGNGASEVQGVTFVLSDEKRAELRSNALEGAMSAARADAGTIAASAGLSIVGVQSASTGGGVGVAYADREAADGLGTTFDPGSVTVTATVDVTYLATAQ
jgi:uncharacterized protein YggE